VVTGDKQDDRAKRPPAARSRASRAALGSSQRWSAAGAASSSPRSRWILALAVVCSVVLFGASVLWLRHGRPTGTDPPALALPGPWEPPTFPTTDASALALDESPESVLVDRSPSSSGAERAGPATLATHPPASRPPTTTAAAHPPPSQPVSANLSLNHGADADGSSKVDGTRFGDVRDGDLHTFWSPAGSTGEISIKWTTPTTVSRIDIRQASGGGTIQSWQVKNHDTGAVLAAGTGVGVITFTPTSLQKITFVILRATGAPRVGEFETFSGY